MYSSEGVVCVLEVREKASRQWTASREMQSLDGSSEDLTDKRLLSRDTSNVYLVLKSLCNKILKSESRRDSWE